MGLPELAQHLRTAAVGGSVTLDSQTLTTQTGLTLPAGYDDDVRAAFGLVGSAGWVLDVQPGQIPDPTGDELHITAGTSTLAALGLHGATVDLHLRVPAGSTGLQVVGEFVLADDWTFAGTFPAMTGYPFEQVTYATPSFVFSSCLLNGFAAAGGVVNLQPRLNFASALRIAGLVDQVRRFVTPTKDDFPFFGPLDVTASSVMPALRVRAELSGTLASVGPLRLRAPFVELRVQYNPKTARRSTVFVFGTQLEVADGFSVDFTAQLLPKPVEMVLAVAAGADHAMTPDALFALVGGQSWGNAVPAPLRTALQSIAFKDLEARTTTGTPPVLNTLATRVGSTKPVPLFDKFTLDEFDVVWVLERDGGDWTSQLQFIASFHFYPELFDGEFEVGISTDLQLWGSFTGKVPLSKLLATITGGTVTPPSGTDFDFTDFSLFLDIQRKSFALFVAGQGIFDPLGTGLLVLSAVQITLASNATTTGRSYDATLDATLVMAGFPLGVTASYATGAGWDFLAAMPAEASVSIHDFLQSLFPTAAIPAFLNDVLVSNVRLAAHAGGSAPGSIDTGATLQLRNIDLGPLGTYTLDANAALKHVGGTTPTTSGSFSFGTTIPGIGARVTVGYAFTSGASQVVSVTWGAFKADYDITKSVLRFSVGEATLGGLLGQVVGLVIGEDGYRLPPPWSVLNELSLRGLAIEFDLGATPRTVKVDYTMSQPIDLGFITITGLTIGKVNDKITVSLDATFIGGAKVPPFDPLDKPPDVPGGSPLDLRLLALGQRVTVPGIEKSKSIDAAVKLLASFTDTPSTGLPKGPTFSASSPWLVGLHVLFVGGTVEVEVVFVDPLLYGLRIALAGEKASVFKGLDFEILYKKVTDTIGVYQIRLTLPEYMRTLQFGALAITLPSVGLDIYTNGDFRVDFGFPYNNDFSRSFGIEYFPFTGAGGFYFAKLSGATSTTLAKPSNPGTFDPVIEFGLGLRLGLGKDISAGILKAGVSLTVFGIVEGVIATWNPDPAALPGAPLPALADAPGSPDVGKSYYYRVAGTIGIIGKIYGSIDFAIIKASLDLTVTISLQAVIEAHQPFLVAFVASVKVALTVSIDLGLFSISIHLSFSMTVRESFTLGSASPAPWGTLGTATPRPALRAAAHAADLAAEAEGYVQALDFAPFAAATDGQRARVELVFAMQPTVAGTPADASTTTGKLVAMLYLDAPDPNAAPPPLPDPTVPLPPAPTSFERFAETVFTWAVAAFGSRGAAEKPSLRAFTATPVTRARIAAAYDYLTSTTRQRPISYIDDIVPGLYPNLAFVVSTGTTLGSAAPFPMIPELRLVAGAVNRRFADGVQVDDTYLANLRGYFETIAARYQDELEKAYGGLPQRTLLTARTDRPTSYSAAIVEDVVLMLARGMLRAGLDAMDAYRYPYGGRRLSAVVAALAELGNTVDAAQLGEANAGLTLTAGVPLALTDLRHQFGATDTFAGVVTGFGADGAAVVGDPRNANVRGILRTGVRLTSGQLEHTVGERDTFADVAALPGWSDAALAGALSAAADAIVPLSVLVLPTARYSTGAADTFAALASAFGTTAGALGTANADVDGLFADPKGTLLLTVPGLVALSPDLILGQLRANEATAHLAGANARFLLYGMRPPAPTSDGSLGTPAALYDLNSQQIDVPPAGVTTATLSIDAAQDWISFTGGPTALSVQLALDGPVSLAAKLVAVATVSGVPARVDAITPLPTFHDDPRRFALRRTAVVQAAAGLSYPLGAGGDVPPGQPRLWFATSSLARALAEPRALRPAFTVEVTTAGDPPVTAQPKRYGWVTVVDVQIKRRDDLPDTYDVFGSDEAGTAALEAMIAPAGPVSIAGIELMTGANATGQAPHGYVDPGLADVRAYLVKSNLSTETNPRGALLAARVAGAPVLTGILNDPLDFVRLLWEASVTRSGGFSLTYRRSGGGGLPDSLFATGDTATLTVVVVHAADGEVVHPSANALLVGDGFDPAHHDLGAVSAPQPVDYVTDGTESLARITERYRVRLSTLATAAAGATLNSKASLAVTGMVHQVRGTYAGHPAVETLDQIATAYRVSADGIRAANPGVTFDPLAALTMLRIPDITVSAATYPTLSAIEGAFGVGAAALAVANAAMPELFAAGQTFTFPDQLVDRVATIPPGNTGFTLTRENPGDGTAGPAATLGAQYNLLGFGLAANVVYDATSDALPAGPVATTPSSPTARDGFTTRAALHATASSADWCYEQVVFVVGAVKGSDGTDPYAGVGSYAQVAFTPRDMFGNVAASVMTQPVLGPAQPQNAAPFRIAYTDAVLGLGGWPSVGVDYVFTTDTTGARVLRLAFSFDVSHYAAATPVATGTDPNEVPAWQQRALADLRTFRTVARQLAAPGVTMTATTTLDGGTPHALDVAAFGAFAGAAAGYLAAVVGGGTPPVPVAPVVDVPVEATNAEDLFALRVEVAVARPAAAVDDAFRGGVAERVVTPVAPRVAKGAEGTQALTQFATDLERAYAAPPVFLKVATGQSQRDTADDAPVWLVRLRTAPGTPADPGIGFAVPGPARYYAPRPLANVLVSRSDVPILAYDPRTGVDWAASTPTAFTGIALDTWGREALAALDRFLSPDFAGAAFLIDHVDPARTGYLAKLLAIKEALATSIASTVTPILTVPALDPADPAPLADATETMRQQILARAENAYVVSAVCQYVADVSSRYTDDPGSGVYAPRFYGPLAAAVTAPPAGVDAAAGGGTTAAQQRPWSLTVARPKLAPGTSFVTTAITVVDPAAQSHLPLTLGFTLNAIEHDISRGVDGEYLASSWLSLVIPFDQQPAGSPALDTAIGAVDVPVVLREIPVAPSLLGQDARPVDDGDEDPALGVEHAKRWRYAFTYDKEVVAQDTIDASVLFNLNDPAAARTLTARELDLFDHLARFVTVWPAMLRTMIEVLVPDTLDLDPASAAYQRARTLVADFQRLLEPVPAAWSAWHALPRRANLLAALSGGTSSEFEFSVQEQKSPDADELVAVRRLGTNTATVWDPATGASVPLPPPTLTVDDGETVWTGEPVEGSPDTFRFVDARGDVLPWSRAVALRRRQPVFGGLGDGGLDVAAYQNAWSAVRVFRNRDLVRAPDGSTIPTSSDFVYATPEVKFASRVTPRLQRDRVFDVAALSSPARRPLVEHVQRVLDLLFEGTAPAAEQLVRLDAEFEQVLGPGLPAAVVPILLGTPTTLTAQSAAALATAVSGYVDTWFGTHSPPDGALRFTLTLFPTLSTSRLPLLQLTGLRLQRADVSDL